jgi:hypothetical protein
VFGESSAIASIVITGWPPWIFGGFLRRKGIVDLLIWNCNKGEWNSTSLKWVYLSGGADVSER